MKLFTIMGITAIALLGSISFDNTNSTLSFKMTEAHSTQHPCAKKAKGNERKYTKCMKKMQKKAAKK